MPLSWPQIHLAAMREAQRAHRELGTDLTRRVDPFDALDRAGVVMFRRRLDNVAGVYMPGDPNAGQPDAVLINSVHPLAKQRYTAAHELAHHRRDRETVVDTETEWLGRAARATSERERVADAFAAWFLMPRELVTSQANRLGIALARPSPQDAYALALTLGTSYAATVHHLSDLGMIGAGTRAQLLRQPPQRIKQSLGARDVGLDAWKDVWLLHHGDAAARVYPLEGDAIVVELAESPSTGYLWQTGDVPPWLELVREEFRTSDAVLVGGTGEHRFIFRVTGPGLDRVSLVRRRPWEPDAIADSFGVEVAALPQPGLGFVQPELLAAAGAPLAHD